MAEKLEGQSRWTGRQQALRRLLAKEEASTQDELRAELEKLSYDVNQSTISRDLRKLGAIKFVDPSGQTVYRLAEEVVVPVHTSTSLGSLVSDIQHNGAMIVIHTAPGSASLVARTIDQLRHADGVLGTIAGDDTVFVAPRSLRDAAGLKKRIERLLAGVGEPSA